MSVSDKSRSFSCHWNSNIFLLVVFAYFQHRKHGETNPANPWSPGSKLSSPKLHVKHRSVDPIISVYVVSSCIFTRFKSQHNGIAPGLVSNCNHQCTSKGCHRHEKTQQYVKEGTQERTLCSSADLCNKPIDLNEGDEQGHTSPTYIIGAEASVAPVNHQLTIWFAPCTIAEQETVTFEIYEVKRHWDNDTQRQQQG